MSTLADERFVEIGLFLISHDDRDAILDGIEATNIGDIPIRDLRTFLDSLVIMQWFKIALGMLATTPLIAVVASTGPRILNWPLFAALMWIPMHTIVLLVCRHTLRGSRVSQFSVRMLRLSPLFATLLAVTVGSVFFATV